MKKTLVALAALAAAGAYAQSSVTIDGYFDRGYTTVSNSDSSKNAKTVASSAGTTTVGVSGVEDVGGGLKVGFRVNTDWNEAGGLKQNSGAGLGATNTPTAGGSFGNSQSYLEVASATMGTLRAGNINNELLTLATNGVASPAFSTGVGSAYSSNYSGFVGAGTGATDKPNQLIAGVLSNTAGSAGARAIRQANTLKYISPNFSGFQVAYGFAPKVNEIQGATIGANNLAGVTDLSLSYANGPLAVMYAQAKYSAPSNGAVAGTALAGLLTTLGANSVTNTHSMLGASYVVLPGLKLHAGFGSSKSSGLATNVDVRNYQYGATYTTGAWDLMGQLAKSNDKTTANIDRKMTGLGVNYNFSKTARAYFRYDNINYYTAGTFVGSTQKRTAIGVSKFF